MIFICQYCGIRHEGAYINKRFCSKKCGMSYRSRQATKKYRAKPGYKWCNDCKEFLPVEQFWKNKTKVDGLDSYCKKHTYLRNRKYTEENFEEVQDYKREWYLKRKGEI